MVKQNEATDPLHVDFFCAVGVMLEANGIANLVKEPSGWVLHEIVTKVADSVDHPIMGG
jgi:hypothetical protein